MRATGAADPPSFEELGLGLALGTLARERAKLDGVDRGIDGVRHPLDAVAVCRHRKRVAVGLLDGPPAGRRR